MIKVIGRIDKRTGPLTNLTDGGEGLSGHKHGLRARALMSSKSSAYQQSLTKEQRSDRARAREARKTPEARSATARMGARNTPKEILTKRGKAGAAAFTSEQLTARLNGYPFEERSARLKKAFARMPKELRSERARAGGRAATALLTSAEQGRRALKGSDKNSEYHKDTRWINNGISCKQQKQDLALPAGWKYGRLKPAVFMKLSSG